VGGRAGDEPDELDPAHRGHGRPLRRPAGRADRHLPEGLGRRRLGAHAALSVSRSILPITTEEDRAYFGGRPDEDQVGLLEGLPSRFGRSYTGEPDAIVAELAQDAAVRAADTLLVTVPNMLGVDYNARLLATITRDIAPALGWQPA